MLFSGTIAAPAPKQIRLVKGSHLVVPRLNNSDDAYILQNEDERIVFVIPYEEHFSLIGTTDVDYEGDPSLARISPEETNYLLRIVNTYFRHQTTPEDVIWSYSGVRPLIDDGENAQEASRDYSYELDNAQGVAPLMSIFGGKITTYRKLAEVATNKLCEFFPTAGAPWTQNAVLPGGNFHSKASLLAELSSEFPWLPQNWGNVMCELTARRAGIYWPTLAPLRNWACFLPAICTRKKSTIWLHRNGHGQRRIYSGAAPNRDFTPPKPKPRH